MESFHFSRKNFIQKSWFAKIFLVPPNSAPGLRHWVDLIVTDTNFRHVSLVCRGHWWAAVLLLTKYERPDRDGTVMWWEERMKADWKELWHGSGHWTPQSGHYRRSNGETWYNKTRSLSDWIENETMGEGVSVWLTLPLERINSSRKEICTLTQTYM